MVYIFDLDDTLYPEMTYACSGLAAVADFLARNCGIDRQYAYDYMVGHLATHGRGQIFNALLTKINAFSDSRVKKCISVYRTHIPVLSLYKDAVFLLDAIKNKPVYIVTDGNKLVQNIKCESLRLKELVKKIFITHRYGVNHAKPSPYCFLKICELEKIPPHEAVYVGDNPYKDFIGIKPFGFKTVRILRGAYKDVRLSEAHEADATIQSLDEFHL